MSLPPWITQKTSHYIKCLKTARKNFPEFHDKVIALADLVDTSAETDKVEYEQELAAERASSKLFKYFKAFRKSNLPRKMFYESVSEETDKGKSELFSIFFSSVYTKSTKFIKGCNGNECVKSITTVNFFEKEVIEICMNLDINKSKGPVEIPAIVYKKLCITLSHSLSQLFRKIFQTANFPNDWKQAIISPLFKKGDKCHVTNYKPVSLLSIASKILERIIFRRLYDHYHSCFHAAQFGFRKRRSTILQLIIFLQKVYQGIESQHDVDIIFTDYSKAFDRVDHGMLLKKLFETGIRNKLLKLIESYLTNRVQVVRINGVNSSPIQVTSGVPQGSILGPILFLVFVNDLPKMCDQLFPLLFADDAKFLSVGLSTIDIQSDLNALYDWTVRNNMPFNMDKCCLIKMSKNEKRLLFGNELIKTEETQSDLGLMLSCDLKWNLHINKVCCKAIRIFHMIKRSVSNLGQKAKMDLYKSMIVPILTYASPCYGLSKYIITELENVQRRIVKWIIPHMDSYKDRLIEISLLPLPMYIQINNLLLLSKILSKNYDVDMLNVPSYSCSSRGCMFQLERPKKKFLEDEFFYQTCRLANVIKIDVRETSRLKKRILWLFWRKFEKDYEQMNKCTRRIACDCTMNDCRSKTSL